MSVIRPAARLNPAAMRRAGQEDIAAALGEEILSGARKPGERMPTDADMLKTFGVSRVVTREVIKTLAAKGLVASRMKVGTVVLDPAHWNWLDADVLSWRANAGVDLAFLQHLTDVRRAVEPTAAALAALHGDHADVTKLREIVQGMADAEKDRRRFAEWDLRFHLTVCAASKNPFFQSFAGMIETALFALLSINALDDSPKLHTDSVARHTLIVDAIEARDPHLAARAMLRAVDGGFTHAKKVRKQTAGRP